LIHVEGIFDENAFTLSGRFAHERADEASESWENGVRTVRGLPIWSDSLGLVGKADVVEFPEDVPYPVDYKRGRRRKHENDDVQLCAQGLCLEEMLSVEVPGGAVYHVSSKRRREVRFTDALRETTCAAVEKVRALLASAEVPPAVLTPRCDGCSLRAACVPEAAGAPAVARWCRELFGPRAPGGGT
jgi:CRISPR-associated exonuclease Cas4